MEEYKFQRQLYSPFFQDLPFKNWDIPKSVMAKFPRSDHAVTLISVASVTNKSMSKCVISKKNLVQ